MDVLSCTSDPRSPRRQSSSASECADTISSQSVNSNTIAGAYSASKTIPNRDITSFGTYCMTWCISQAITGTGSGCMQELTTAKRCSGFGFKTLSEITEENISDDCTAFGYMAGAHTNAHRLTAFGSLASFNNQVGSDNCAFGDYSQFSNITGSRNSSQGSRSLSGLIEGDDNTAMGYCAAESVGAFSGITAYGSESARYNTGKCNTAHGTRSLKSNQNGNNNSATGFESLESGHGVSGCTAMGAFSCKGVWGTDNSGFGFNTMAKWPSTGSENTASGAQSLYSCRSSRNTGNGFKSLFLCDSGNHNVADGHTCMMNLVSGSKNSGCGACAGVGIVNGSSNSFIGHQSGPSADVSNSLCLGALAKSSRNGEFVIGSAQHPLETTRMVGMSGDASTPPGRPVLYMQITYNGEELVIPAYKPFTNGSTTHVPS